MGAIWFTADLHLGHKLVAGLRGFEDTTHHDDAIMSNWAKVVSEEDQVWVLGDLAVSSPIYALEVIANLPGSKHLIVGNHDEVHPMHRNAHKHQALYMSVFDSVQTFARRKMAGHFVLLSHFPYHDDHTNEDRYSQYRLPDEGMWLLHGHTHSSERLHGHEVHVGLDAWDLTPVLQDTVAKEILANPDRGANRRAKHYPPSS